MHGVVHQRFKEYVVEGADEATWQAVLDRAGIEPTLYLAVSSYPDEEFDDALEALAALSGYDRTTIERDFGRYLAPTLCSTFHGYLPRGDLPTLLHALASVSTVLDDAGSTTKLPEITSASAAEGIRVTYRSERGYCSMARGILEGLITEYEADASVRKNACVDAGDEMCAFLVTIDS